MVHILVSPQVLLYWSFFFFFCSESERSMGRIGPSPPPVGSHFGTFADVCDDTDPHLFRLPELDLLLGQTAVLVHSVDTNYRVSTIKHCYCTSTTSKKQECNFGMSSVFKNVPWLYSFPTVPATIHHPSTNLSLMTQRWMTTTLKPLRTPASSTFPAFSILLSPLFSQRGNLSDSLATKIVWDTDGHRETFPKVLKG